MALALPGVMLLLFGYALTLDVDQIPMSIYDQDQSPQSRELVSRFQGSRYFNVLGTTTNYETIERAIDRGTAMAALVISADLSEDLSRDRNPSIQILFDGSWGRPFLLRPSACWKCSSLWPPPCSSLKSLFAAALSFSCSARCCFC